MYIPFPVLRCMELLNLHGFECFAVGGAVRDALLGREVHDYDLTTDALPEEMHQVFREYPVFDTGIAHGTVTVLCDGTPIEITTYRTEGSYTDHRHPDQVHFTRSLKEDCARRDLTINAIAYNPSAGIRDYFHGCQDLENRMIRTVGDPVHRYEEDALRILRTIRFAAELGFQIEEKTSSALVSCASLLSVISKERITSEWLRILSAPECAGLLKDFRPVVENIFSDAKQVTESNWRNMCGVISRSPANALMRSALLLKCCLLPENTLSRLRLSRKETKTVLCYVRTAQLPLNTKADLKRAAGTLCVPVENWLQYRCLLNPSLDQEQLLNIWNQVLTSNGCWKLSDLAVSGKDLNRLGLQGKQTGEALAWLLDQVIEEKVPNQRDALLQIIKTEYLK